MRAQPTRMIDAEHIKQQAEKIRDIAQDIIDACDDETAIKPLSRNKVVGGSLAGDAASLGIAIVQYEYEEK